MRRNHSVIGCPRHIYVVFFFAHILFVVNHTFNAQRSGRNNISSFLQRTAPIARFFCEGWIRHDLHILVTAPFCCDRKARAACAQSFAPWQKATIEIMRRNHSIIGCSRYIYFFLRAHPVRGESHNQRNTTGEVATVSCSFGRYR